MGRENYADWAFSFDNLFVLEGLTKCNDGSEIDTDLVSKGEINFNIESIAEHPC